MKFAPLAAVLGLGLGPTAPARADAPPKAVREFFDAHCLSCHDDTTAKAKLSLESLPLAFERDAWVRVHDRLKAGEMPPNGRKQPAAAERDTVVQWLAGELTKAARARQASEGRVTWRRLNRREYETTLHDLLGIAVPLQDMLPEDTPVHGFDTVSRGLDTSAAHLLAFQRAADAAIGAALPGFPLSSKTTRWTGRGHLEGRLPVYRKDIDPFARVAGDAVVYHARLYGDLSAQAPHPPVPGRYRIRAAVRPVNTGDRPLSVLVGKRVDRFQAEKLMHMVEVHTAAPGRTTVIEAETDLGYTQRNQFIYLEALELPFFTEFEKQRGADGRKPLGADVSGPGLAVEWAELEGPLGCEEGPARLFGDLPRLPRMPAGRPVPEDWRSWPLNGGEFARHPLAAVPRSSRDDADRLIRAFLPLAFRHLPTEERAASYVKLVRDRLDRGESFDDAMRAGYKAILCSAEFLTFLEKPGRLDDYAVAARLARFLWSSAPDRELYDLAARGTLTRPEVLRAQTERMLEDPRAARFRRSFTDQWLDLGKFFDMKPDDVYAEYDDLLAWSMVAETRKFFDEVLARDLPTSSFLHSDWTFLNARLATHYGLPAVPGLALRRVALALGSHRGGVITHGSVLKLTTNASYTSPIKRGAWVLERLLGSPPPPPPPDVTAVEPDIRGATTIREQLAKHKASAACAVCHARIDPPGFALETFDVLGGWRDRYRVKRGGGAGTESVDLPNYPGRKVWLARPVQADGETEAGEAFRDIDDYKRHVLRDPDRLTRNLAEKLVVYATGAGPDFADRAAIDALVAETRARKHGFRSLIHAVVQSPIFLHK
jgi:mono/diheme cytochrome c family protein